MKIEPRNHKMNEYNFVSKFVGTFNKSNTGMAVQPTGKNQSTFSDCEIIFNSTIVKLEAKKLKDTRSNSANFFNLLGEIMAADKKISKLQTQPNWHSYNMCSGILIPDSSKSVFDKLWSKNISKSVGNIYC